MKRTAAGILLLLCVILSMEARLLERSRASVLTEDCLQSDAFRKMELSQKSLKFLAKTAAESGKPLSVLLANGMLNEAFSLREAKEGTFTWDTPYVKYKRNQYEALVKAYRAVWEDVRCFPLTQPVFYQDTWGAQRSHGGERLHEGCDLFGRQDVPGIYPVWSMTDGTVERVGWLPLGGYRIGVRSPGGGYFYYAHLSSYGRNFEPGDSVKAGEFLGFMGNTGYGSKGTKGEFPTHLHLGIYIRTEKSRELSVNPYWVLYYLEHFYHRNLGDFMLY